MSLFTEEEERRLLLRLVGGVEEGDGQRLVGQGMCPDGAPSLPPLNPHDFARPAHQLIWKALVALAYQGLAITPRAVAAQMVRTGGGEGFREALFLLMCAVSRKHK